MRFCSLRRYVPLTPLLASSIGGCTLWLEREEGQCDSHADCASLAGASAPYVCSADRVCVPLRVYEPDATAYGGADCVEHRECGATLGLSLCRGGRCQPLNAAEAGCVSQGWGTTAPIDAADVLPVGVLVSPEELRVSPARRALGAVVTALAELNAARLESNVRGLPALVAIACDETNPRAIEYLTQVLRVRLVIGPSEGGDVAALLARWDTQAALFTPFADSPTLASSVASAARAAGNAAGGTAAPSGTLLLVGCKPNRAGARPYLLDAVAEARSLVSARAPELGSLVTALAVSGDLPTTAFADAIDDSSLDGAGIRRARYTAEPGGIGLVNVLSGLDPRPNLLVAASAEDAWQDNIEAFDGVTHAAGGAYPYYLLSDKRAEVVAQTVSEQITAKGAPRQYMRVLGLDYQRSEQSRLAYASFRESFLLHTGGRPVPGAEYAYDCSYAAVFAALAARLRFGLENFEPSPAQLAAALPALRGGGPALPVRALSIGDVLDALDANRGLDGSLDLIGASGGLDLSLDATGKPAPSGAIGAYYRVEAPGGELYCVDTHDKEFCDMGITFPSTGGPPRRAPSRCACLGAE